MSRSSSTAARCRARTRWRPARRRSPRSTCCRLFREAECRSACWSPPARACSCSSARPAAGASRVAAFLGDNVTLALADPRDGTLVRRARPRPLRRQAAALDRRRARAGPNSPCRRIAEGEDVPIGDGKAAAARDPEADLGAGSRRRRREPGRLWAGTLPGGLFRSDDRGASWQLVRGAMGPPGAHGNGSAAATTRPASIPSAWIRAIRAACASPSPPAACGAATTAARRWAQTAHGMFADVPAAGDGRRSESPGRASHGAVPRRAGPALGAAPQRRVPQRRRRRAAGTRCRTSPPSVFGFAVAVHPHEPDTRLVRAGDQGRDAASRSTAQLVVARTRDGGAQLRDPRRRPAAGASPTTWSTATAWPWTRPATAWPSARPPAGSGSATIGGDRWHPIGARLPPILAVSYA